MERESNRRVNHQTQFNMHAMQVPKKKAGPAPELPDLTPLPQYQPETPPRRESDARNPFEKELSPVDE